MSWLVTSSGHEIDLTAGPFESLGAYDIAWSLSQRNRFNGWARRPYSVAEHSLLVCEIVDQVMGLDVHAQFAALMHDAHECLTGDMTTPAKKIIGRPWQEFEDWRAMCLRRAHGITVAFVVNGEAVHMADLIALATEKRDLMHESPRPWPQLSGIEPLDWVDLYSPERIAMSWEDWRDRWLDKYHELEYARNDRLFGTGTGTSTGTPHASTASAATPAHSITE